MNHKKIKFSVKEIEDLLQKINSDEFATIQYVDEAILNAEFDNNGESIDLSKYALKTELNNYALKSSMPTKISQLTNDSSFLTSVPSEYITETELTAKSYATKTELNNYALKSSIPTKISQLDNDLGFLTNVPSEYVTESELTVKNYATKTELNNLNSIITNLQSKISSLEAQIEDLKNNSGNSGGTEPEPEIPSVTYTIQKNLTNVTTTNTITSVEQGKSYYATFRPNSGYTIKSIVVTMGGTNITSQVATLSGSNYIVDITSVTGNIVITIATETSTTTEPTTEVYNISYTIPTGVTINNKPATVQQNSSFTATITEQEGYEITSVTVTMGGTDITSNVVSDV